MDFLTMNVFFVLLACIATCRCSERNFVAMDCEQDVIIGAHVYGTNMDHNYTMPAVAGRRPGLGPFRDSGLDAQYGFWALRDMAFLILDYPLRDGVLSPARSVRREERMRKALQDLTQLWYHTLYRINHGCSMDLATGDPNALILVMSPREKAENLVQYLDYLMIPCHTRPVVIHNHASMAAYSLDQEDILVVDVGLWVTTVTPVKAFQPIVEKMSKLDSIGTMYMNRKIGATLNLEGLKRPYTLKVADDIWKKLGFVSQDYDADNARPESDFTVKYRDDYMKLEIDVGKILFQSNEYWFKDKPKFSSLQTEIVNHLRDLDESYRQNIVLTGVGSLLCGLEERLEKELKTSGFDVKITSQGDDPGFILRGALKFNEQSSDSQWLSLEEFQQEGLAAIKKKWTWFQ